MSAGKPRASRRTEGYDEVVYRDALRTLGLFVPAPLDEINQAYRSRAKVLHPDRLGGNGDAAEATRRIQRLNTAHEYLLRHHGAFQRAHGRAWRRARRANGDGTEPAGAVAELFFAPITVIYAAALVVAAFAAAPLAAVARRSRDEPGGSRWKGALWESWLGVGPHLALLAGFFLLEVNPVGPGWMKWWIGGTFLVLVSTAVASRLTGESNPLRQLRTHDRLQALVRGY